MKPGTMAFATKLVTRAFSTGLANNAIQKITVIGGGQMGAGIAQVAAQSGHQVTIVDVSDDLLQKSHATISKSLSRVVKKKFAEDKEGGEKFIADTMGLVSTSTDPSSAVQDTDLVVEAIIENLDIKKKLFSTLDEAAPQHAIFASNTSSLAIKDIASATKRLDKFGGLHFFNPVPMMKLVEVVRTPETSEETNTALTEFSKKIGKVPVQAKDVPGFIVNRLLVPYLMESVKMVERGEATMEDVDAGMKLGAGYPMGPFQLIDYVGLDTMKFIYDGWHQIFPGHQMFEPSELLNQKVAEGKLGVKSGEGFYNYKK